MSMGFSTTVSLAKLITTIGPERGKACQSALCNYLKGQSLMRGLPFY
jgi:hypothetical protein